MKNKHIFLTSLILTILIFGSAMALNYSLDFFRLDSIVGIMNEHEISYEAYLTEERFVDVFGGDKCAVMSSKIKSLNKEIEEVGVELSNYGGISFFKKNDYKYLSRKYFLLELKFMVLIDALNKDCNKPYIPILFFYELGNDVDERQGYILSELNKAYKGKIVVVSLDKDYESEPLIQALVMKHNITTTPTVIIDNRIKYERLVYEKEIEADVNKIIADSDFYGGDNNWEFTIKRTGTEIQDFISNMTLLLKENISNFAKGDITLMIGRVTKNTTMICDAVDYYESINTSNIEEKAIIYETIASLGCGRNRKEYLLKSAELWKELGVEFRAEIDTALALEKTPNLKFSIIPFEKIENEKIENISTITIGSKSVIITADDILVSQSDRVSRDWLGYQVESSPFSENILTTFSERLYYNETELLAEIGWHEGGRISELKQSGLNHLNAAGTIVAEKEGKWYAPNENGVFMFEVPLDKVLYPTTRIIGEGIAVIIDTHGVNMIVEQALRNNATVAVGCGDHPGKVKASKYLAERGVTVISFPDKYLSLMLGEDYPVFGSPSIRKNGSDFIIGGQPITFPANSTVIASAVGNYTNVQSYYDTPARYFMELDKITELNVIYVPLEKMNTTNKIIDSAEFFNSNVIGVRIFNSDDYSKVKSWLEKDINNKAVLFHSMPYPYGYKLLKEFPKQATFGDITPIFS